MAKSFFSGRIPQSLNDHVTKFCEDTGKTKTDILIEALAKYTGFELPLCTSTKEINSLLNIDLIQSLQNETQKLQEIVHVHEQRIEFLEKITTKHKNGRNSSKQLALDITVSNADNSNNSNDNVDTKSDNSVIEEYTTETSIQHKNLSQREIARLVGVDPYLFINHRKNLVKQNLPLDTPLKITLNGQSYHAVCTIAEGKNIKWDAIPIKSFDEDS